MLLEGEHFKCKEFVAMTFFFLMLYCSNVVTMLLFFRLDALSSTINTVQENFDYQRTMAAKVDSLETKLNACNASLEWIISALINKDFIPEASGTSECSHVLRTFILICLTN